MQKTIQAYKNRIAILMARDAEANRNIINKLVRKVRQLENNEG